MFIAQQSTYAESLSGSKLEAVSFYNDEGLIAVRDANRDEQDMLEGGGSSSFGDDKSALEKIEEKFADLKEQCMTSGAASSIGWVLCPVMTWLASTAEGIYNKAIVPRLQVDTDILKPFTGSGESSVKGAWNTFRNFANIAFVVLFAVVILSQITGIGINNYGIKKILPKLIVAAVLVNLSYYIVLIAVDVSNIIGVGAKGLFDSLAEQVSVPSEYATEFGSATGATLLTGVGILLAICGGIASIVLNPAILLSLFIGVIGLVISLFTLLVLLAAREVIIVILVVVSPVALVCYMLPNTKKLFDKWFKIIEAMLLVFPICGIMMGAGNYVSKLILASHSDGVDFVTGFIAMLASIVPIFFIPKVLKSSFDGVGKLGAKITDYGKNIRGRTQGAMRNSEAYKRAQSRMNAGVRLDGSERNGVRKRLANTGVGHAIGLDRSMAAAREQVRKDRAGDQKARNMVGMGWQAAMIDEQKAAEKEQLGQWITFINDKTRNGEDSAKLFDMYDEYSGMKDPSKANKMAAVAVARIAGRRKDTAADFLAKKVTGTGLESDGDRAALARSNETNRSIFQAVSKEISTGETSGNYRESAPLGFEFAAMHNRDANPKLDSNGQPLLGADGQPVQSTLTTDYSKWRDETSALHDALDKYVTDSKALVGLKGSTLKEFSAAMKSGAMDPKDQAMLSRMATDSIMNRDKGPWDYTKAAVLCEISGQFTYDSETQSIKPITAQNGRNNADDIGDGSQLNVR